MEFFDLIKTPKLDGVIMCDTLQNKIEGTLCITSHHLIISSRKTMEFNELVVSMFFSFVSFPRLIIFDQNNSFYIQ